MTQKSVLKSRAFLDLSRSFGEQRGHAVRPDFSFELRYALNCPSARLPQTARKPENRC